MINRAGMLASIARDYYYIRLRCASIPADEYFHPANPRSASSCTGLPNQKQMGFQFRSPGNRFVCSTSTIRTGQIAFSLNGLGRELKRTHTHTHSNNRKWWNNPHDLAAGTERRRRVKMTCVFLFSCPNHSGSFFFCFLQKKGVSALVVLFERCRRRRVCSYTGENAVQGEKTIKKRKGVKNLQQ